MSIVVGSKVTLKFNSTGLRMPFLSITGNLPSTAPCNASFAVSNWWAGSDLIS